MIPFILFLLSYSKRSEYLPQSQNLWLLEASFTFWLSEHQCFIRKRRSDYLPRCFPGMLQRDHFEEPCISHEWGLLTFILPTLVWIISVYEYRQLWCASAFTQTGITHSLKWLVWPALQQACWWNQTLLQLCWNCSLCLTLKLWSQHLHLERQS